MAAPYHGLVAYICLSTSDQSFATVIVGPEERRFVVHEAILNHYSKFFRKAFTGEFEEAKRKTITLAEDSILTFEFFVHWFYKDRILDRVDDIPITHSIHPHYRLGRVLEH